VSAIDQATGVPVWTPTVTVQRDRLERVLRNVETIDTYMQELQRLGAAYRFARDNVRAMGFKREALAAETDAMRALCEFVAETTKPKTETKE
jgi:hypothetical protein